MYYFYPSCCKVQLSFDSCYFLLMALGAIELFFGVSKNFLDPLTELRLSKIIPLGHLFLHKTLLRGRFLLKKNEKSRQTDTDTERHSKQATI